MGIQDLNSFLNETMDIPRTRDIPLLDFKGQPIAIDGHNWAYMNIAVANKVVTGYTNVGSQEPDREAVLQKWLYSALETVCMFLSHGATPVFIFDGVHLAEKANTQDKRKQEKIKDRDLIKQLQAELKEVSPFDRDPEKVQKLRQLLSRSNYIAKEEMQQLKDLLSGIGIPVLQAEGDAEQLCASLAKEGLVSAVFSEDTDNLVYGCPILITGFGEKYFVEEDNRSYRMATCVLLVDVLQGIQLSHQEFIELCIMCGCDFNTRIFRLGPKTAYKLIKEYHSIDDLPKKYDTTCLQASRCREIFTHRKPEAVDSDGNLYPVIAEDLVVHKDLLFTQGEENLSLFSAGQYVRRLWGLYTNLPDAKGQIREYPRRRKIVIRRKLVFDEEKEE